MEVVHTVAEARRAVQTLRNAGRTVGLVPTMGALHAGHLSLVRAALSRCDYCAVSIFVNPTQFGPGEDFDRYPRTLEADCDLLRREGAHLVFAPEAKELYPEGFRAKVVVAELSEGLCGAFRPGHFEGVATVVCKLFHILPADAAFFGEKDYQQLVILRRMARDLDFPIDVVGCPIVREPEGLALSSRNAYLTPSEREQALHLSAALFDAADQVKNGARRAPELIEGIKTRLRAAGIERIDYVAAVDPGTLAPMETLDRPGRLCLAAHVGACRLIDNVAVAPPID